MTRPTVGIFAGSSTPKDPVIMQAAIALGTALGAAGYDIVYGGGTQGVMGAVAAAAQAAGAHVTAVVLEKYAHEAQLPGAAQISVATEQERFAVLTTHNSPVASFALPGGPGTLREAMQALEKAVYDNGAPVVLVQAGAYLDGVSQYFNAAIAGGLVKADKAASLRSWKEGQDPSAIINPPAAKAAFIKPAAHKGP